MIQVINRALNILEVLAQEPNREFGLSEITQAVNLNPGTCANILKTLVMRNYVEQSGAKRGYRLGPMSYQLACDDALFQHKLTQAACGVIDRLRDCINETVILSIIRDKKRVLLYEATGTQEVQVRTTYESSVYRATTGRLILAYYTPQELDMFLGEVGLPTAEEWPEVKTKSQLIEMLAEIRLQGMAFSHNKNHVIGFATPVFRYGKVIASLGVYLPDIRYGEIERALITSELLKATEAINRLSL